MVTPTVVSIDFGRPDFRHRRRVRSLRRPGDLLATLALQGHLSRFARRFNPPPRQGVKRTIDHRTQPLDSVPGTVRRTAQNTYSVLHSLEDVRSLCRRDDADARRKKRPPLKTLWAIVRINADHSITVTRSKGVTGSIKQGTGAYKIGFNRNVSGCVSVATLRLGSLGFITSEVGPLHAVATEREVTVSAYDTTGTSAERGFHLIVHC